MGRLLPGPLETVSQESISGRLLVDLGVIDPDFMPTIFTLHQEVAPTIALLDTKGYKTSGINYGTNWLTEPGGRFRTVTSNHVQFRIAADDWRVERFRPNAAGLTFEDAGNPSYPGLGKNWFYIYLDSNWVGGNEVILLADGKTQLWVMDKEGGVEVSGGVWRYRVKVNGNNADDYASPDYMQDGDECQVVYSQYRQDWSTGGNEKHTFGGFGDAYLTLQRFKYSYSGTASAMDKNKKVTGRWVQAGDYNQKSFISQAQDDMMKMIAKYADFQIMEGKSTVDSDTKKVALTDSEYQEVLAGSGILYSGDGPIEFPMNNGWNEQFIESFLADVDTYVRPNEDGFRELALEMHPTSYINFQKVIKKMGATMDNNIEGSGANKVINNTYAGYELGGIRLMAYRSSRLGGRPGKTLRDGTRSNEWDTICYPLGLTQGGERGVQLIQLRPMVNGTVAGIDKGGNVSNDIDGSTEHALIQMGVVSMVQTMKIYRPIANNLL